MCHSLGANPARAGSRTHPPAIAPVPGGLQRIPAVHTTPQKNEYHEFLHLYTITMINVFLSNFHNAD